MDRCGFNIKAFEPATLQGFDNDTPKNKNYKVAEVIMGKVGKKPVVLDALVINRINSIQMTGIYAFAKKVARTVPLADFRFDNQKSDRVEVDLLIAADYRHRIMSMTHPLMQFNGMWFQPIIFGDYILSGPIPGPAA